MDLVKYPEYKDSGAEVIDDIPKSWETHNMKFLIESIESGKREDVIDKKYAFSIGGEHINWNGSLNLKNERYVSKDFYNNLNKGKIKLNDVLLVKDGATIGKTAFISDKPFEKMAVNEHVFIIRSNDMILPKLLYYLVRSNLGFMQIKLTENGSAQGGINSSFPSDVYFPVCDELSTQYKIANYLDNKIAKIDKTIEINQKLIELLEEKRVALINQVVTKGLNPDVEMKDSGIEWIGEIPKHWGCQKISTLSNIGRGASPRPIDDPKYFDENGEYSWVRISDVTSSNKYLKRTTEKLSALGKSLSVSIEPGNVFVSIAGSVGKPIISKIKCCIHDGFVYFKNLTIMDEYLFYIFEGEEPYKGLGKLGTQLNLNTETIGNIFIPLPTKLEQQDIVEYLDNKLANLDKTKSKIQEQIALLEEYKESLIYNVVTGKVDVRGENI